MTSVKLVQDSLFFLLHRHNKKCDSIHVRYAKIYFQNNRHSNLKLDRFEPLSCKTPSNLSIYLFLNKTEATLKYFIPQVNYMQK